MLQLRAAETENATLQVAQIKSADENKALTERLAAITKEANASKLVAKAVDGLKAQVAHQNKEIAQLNDMMESCKQEGEAARNQEIERAQRVDEAAIELEKLVSDGQTKNVALYKIASEILQRYEQFGLGDAIKAREPFVGITRVKLENQVQDYQDKLLNERIKLDENELESYKDKLLNQPAQISGPSASASGQPSE